MVYVSELREFVECDLSNLEEGSSCLTRHEDGIWYPAKIKGIPISGPVFDDVTGGIIFNCEFEMTTILYIC